MIVVSREPVRAPALERAFASAKAGLARRSGTRPRVRTMYHLTSPDRARAIARSGFDLSRSKLKAFGRGVNLCPKAEQVMSFFNLYARRGLAGILVCEVVVARSHSNVSTDRIVRDGRHFYTAPARMRPKRGFDAMTNPSRTIWVIPSARRVLPVEILWVRRA